MAELTMEQYQKMAQLQAGDVFSFRSGNSIKEAEFVSFKQVNLLAKMDDTLYNIRKTSFVDIVRKAATKVAPKMDMKPGDLFYIKQGNNAILFEFVSFNQATIIGKDVLTGGNVRISKGMFAGTVKQYQKAQKDITKAE